MSSILIIGLSRIVKKRVLKAIKKISEIEFWECATKTQCDLAEELGASNTYADYSEALKISKATWVYISLPNCMHEEWIKVALESGKNVIVDKPAVMSVKNGFALLALAKRKKLALSECLAFGFHEQFSFIKAHFLKTSSEIKYIHSWFVIPKLPGSDYRSIPKLGGGAFWDMGVYAMGVGRVLLHKLPETLNISISGNPVDLNRIQAFSILASYSSGEIISGHFGFGFEYVNHIQVVADNSKIELVRPFSLPEDLDIEVTGSSNNVNVSINIDKDDSFYNYFDWLFELEKNNEKETIWDDFEESLESLDILCNSVRDLAGNVYD